MSETKEKKLRVYKLASEINISAEQLVEFLQKKGHVVKTIQSILSEEMLNDINDHFKKDIEKAEKHYKKIAEFNKKRTEKTEAEEEKAREEKAKEEKAREEKPKEEKPKEEPVVEEQPKAEIQAEEVPAETLVPEPVVEPVQEAVPEEPASVEAPAAEVVEQAAAEAPAEQPAAEQPVPAEKQVTEEPVEKPVPVFIAPKDIEAGKRKGLTVVGKIDLDEKKTRPVKKEPASAPAAPVRENGAEKTSAQQQEQLKKKKKPKAKKKPGEAPAEELPVAKKKKRVKKFEIDQKEVKEAIRKTLLSMDDSVVSGRASLRKKKRKERELEEEERQHQKELEENKISVTEFIAVNELANLMGVPVGDVISKCIELGLMVSINQRLDVETITLVADEFGFEVEFQKEYTSEALEDYEDDPETLLFRSPVVTIMGHVDHGKTSLLDYIRRTNVVAGESGGITQHIGAYKVDVGNGKYITFLDTPGHEAFTAMRARGAQITDIVVLIVAADDAVMPQTVEAINHAQAARVPIVIAINKVDKPGSNIEKIKQQLADRNILVEDWGGKYQCVEVSAKTGKNIENLLEVILLEAELLDLKANPDREARGVVVESELDRGRGITGTILVQKGTLYIGDPFVAGVYQGKVRAMFDERGNKVSEVGPSTPVQVLGFEGAPQAGDTFVVVESDRVAREVGLKRQQLRREQEQKQVHHITLDEIAKQISIGGVKELPLIVKGDVDGSVEALSDSLMKLSNQEVVVRVIHKGVGGISESDVLLAAASDAIIIGFHVRPNLNARKLAETQKVDIRLYSVIYNAINEVKSALEGLLSPVLTEEVTGTLEIRETFKVPKFGTVAGCYVLEGKIVRGSKVRLIREGIVFHEGEIASLKRFKDDVREVDAGYECGLNIANFNDIKVGDIIEVFKIVETKKKLL
jgi:translation initiation factor IF-2